MAPLRGLLCGSPSEVRGCLLCTGGTSARVRSLREAWLHVSLGQTLALRRQFISPLLVHAEKLATSTPAKYLPPPRAAKITTSLSKSRVLATVAAANSRRAAAQESAQRSHAPLA